MKWSTKYDSCIKCGTDKTLYLANGLCRNCYHHKYYKEHPYILIKNKELANRRYKENPEILLERTRKYVKTEKGRANKNASSKRMALKHSEKWNARNKLRYAVKIGKIIKPVMCEQYNPHPVIACFGRIEAHHYLGYDEEHWKDVQWLCMKHHKEIHRLKHEKTS